MALEAIAGTLNASTKYRYLRCITLTENAGTPAEAKVEFRDGAAGATAYVVLKFVANETKALSFPRPLYFPSGIYVNVASGTVAGCIDAD